MIGCGEPEALNPRYRIPEHGGLGSRRQGFLRAGRYMHLNLDLGFRLLRTAGRVLHVYICDVKNLDFLGWYYGDHIIGGSTA